MDFKKYHLNNPNNVTQKFKKMADIQQNKIELNLT